MLKYFSTAFLAFIMTYVFVFLLTLNFFLVPAVKVGLVADSVVGFTLLLFLLPLILLLYYVYYVTHVEVKNHLSALRYAFMILTVVDIFYFIIFISWMV